MIPFYEKIQVKQVTKEDWALIADKAHVVVFDEIRPASMDRISYCLMTEIDGEPQSFCTVRELDSESVYWQYGGNFPSSKHTLKPRAIHQKKIDWTKAQGYKRITTYIRNTNKTMMRFALEAGFVVVGVRIFQQEIYVELLLEF